jgi:hypothetical protein
MNIPLLFPVTITEIIQIIIGNIIHRVAIFKEKKTLLANGNR